MFEVLNILYEAAKYCVKATIELFVIGVKSLFYELPLYIKDTFGEKPYTMQILEPPDNNNERRPRSYAGSGQNISYKESLLSDLPLEEDADTATDDPDTNLNKFLKALSLSNKAA